MSVPEEAIGTVPVCRSCGSARVARDAWACFNPRSGLWELENVFDHAHCHACEAETSLDWSRPEDPIPELRVRELNDAFRTNGQGGGQVVITNGISDLGEEALAEIVRIVQGYDTFNEDNDPWGEHDFGAFDYQGQKLFWKIDCYNLDYTTGSENPANPALTRRVLTIMLASEY